ncbi:jg15995 [Pararge aegeria aegeria]|uniref:Jg15995 protein n=1 Tax=Pararge aegeria aegeria TaxID=348720 RepID=A0A8S4SIS5_9NEOP|nr:jg15995 [Pararge aegeria aegeria]
MVLCRLCPEAPCDAIDAICPPRWGSNNETLHLSVWRHYSPAPRDPFGHSFSELYAPLIVISATRLVELGRWLFADVCESVPVAQRPGDFKNTVGF